MAKIKQSKLNEIKGYNDYKKRKEEEGQKKQESAAQAASPSTSNTKNTSTTGTQGAKIKQSKLNQITGYKEYKERRAAAAPPNATSVNDRSQQPNEGYTIAEIRQKLNDSHTALTSSETAVNDFLKRYGATADDVQGRMATKYGGKLDNTGKYLFDNEVAYNSYLKEMEALNALYNQYNANVNQYNDWYKRAENFKSTASGWDIAKQAGLTGLAYSDYALASSLDFLMPTEFLGEYDIFSKWNDKYTKLNEYHQQALSDMTLGKGKGAQIAAEMGSATVAALPQAVLAMMTGGASAPATLTSSAAANSGTLAALGTAATEMVKNPLYWSSFAQTVGPAYDDAKAMGMDDFRASAYAVLSSGMNAGVEVGGGLEVLPARVKSGDMGALAAWVLSAPEEGIEEVVQRFISGSTEKALYDHDKPFYSTTDENAIINPEEMGKEFLMGTGVALSLGGVQTGVISGANAAINRANNKQYGRIGTEYTEATAEIISEGLAMPKNTEAYKTATELKAKVDAGQTISDAELGRAVVANEMAIQQTPEIRTESAQETLENLARETVAQRENTQQAQPAQRETVSQQSTVPYNVMSEENPVRQQKVAETRSLEKKLGYGENGLKLFKEIAAENQVDETELMARFDKPYQAGLTGLPVEKASLANDFQMEAYKAGLQDYNLRQAQDKAGKPSAVYSEQESGFDFTNAPSDLTQEYKDFAVFVNKKLGVKGEFNGYDGVNYNAKYTKDTGVVAFAQDFGIDSKLMKKLGSMDYQQKVEKLAATRGRSFVFYFAHEVADHVASDRAPAAMRAFNNAMYNYRQSEAGSENLARSKQAFYGDNKVDLSTEGAIEEVGADSILMLYDGDEKKFMDAMRRVLSGEDQQAKEGAKIYKNKLDEVIQKLKAWFRKLTGKENAEARANLKQGITELERLRDMFEQAIAEAAKNVKAARGLENRGAQEYNGSNKSQLSLKNDGELTHDELSSVFAYKSGGSYLLNAMLYTGAELNDYYTAMRDNLDAALEKLPVHTGTVYRNLGFDDFGGKEAMDAFVAQHADGEPIRYGSYPSSSKVADGHPIDGEYVVNLEIESVTGRDMEGFGNNFEDEVLFGRKTWFIPTKITVGADGRPLIVMKEAITNGTRVHEGRDDRHSGRTGTVQQGAGSASGAQVEVRDVRAVHAGNADVQAVPGRHPGGDSGRGRSLSEVSEENVNYSLKDSEGNTLSKQQQEYFRDSKVRDEQGRLVTVYHSSPTAGFTVFNGEQGNGNYRFSEYGTGITFFTDNKEMAASYGNGEGGQYEGYLNITNPYVVDAKGRFWDRVSSEFSQGLYEQMRDAFTAEEKAALISLAGWEDFSAFNEEVSRAVRDSGKPTADKNTKVLNSAFWKCADMAALFSMASENFSDDVIRRNSYMDLTTNEIVEKALQDGSYDGVIIKNVIDYGVDGLYNSKSPTGTDYIIFNSNQFKAKDNKNPTEDPDIRYSIKSTAAAAGLDVTRDEKGKVVFKLDGKVVTKVTPEHIQKNSGLGGLITVAAIKGHITDAEAIDQYKAMADIMNMIMNTQDPDLVWAWVGASMFSALKKNADGQYGTTIDFTTVCRKTQDIITAMSRAMMKMKRGLSKDEVTKLQAELITEGSSVPCPVCYVFSRWAGIGSILDNMYRWQEKYDGYTDEQLRKRVDELTEKLGKGKVKDLKKMLREQDEEYDSLDHESEMLALEKKQLTAKRKKAIRENIAHMLRSVDDRMKEVEKRIPQVKKRMSEIQASVAPELAWLLQVRTNPDYAKHGKVKPNVLFNLDDAATFAESYPLAWKYRTSRGPSAGKAILPYSDMRLGDMILGVDSNSATGNDLFANVTGQFTDEQMEALDKAIKRTKAQNLIGGQRFQSTSDFRYDYALDYLMAFFECQALGSKLQTYTKIIEFADMVAAVRGDVNLSVMPKNKGYITTSDGVNRLVFSSVTGIDFEAAQRANELHDSAQLILVGINDNHILAALEDSEETLGKHIGFVIPYHASGASINEFIRVLVSNLGESFTLNYYQDYSDVQSDKERSNATDAQKRRNELRSKLLKGKDGGKNWEPSEDDLAFIRGKSVDISGKSFADLRSIERKALSGNKAAIAEYESWTAGALWDLYNKMWVEGGSEYGVRLNTNQAKAVMPHEYWNKTVNRDKAYINGFLFRSYCYNLGLTPRFSGATVKGEKHGDFTDSKGYWKTLIDRPMYNNDGTYRDQQTVNVSSFQKDMLTQEYAKKHWDGYSVQEPDVVRAGRAADRFIEKSQNGQYSLKDDSDFTPEAKDIIRRLKQQAKFSKYGTRKYASYTAERMDRELREASAKGSPDYAKSYIAWMTPSDFVYATTTSQAGREQLKSEAGKLDLERLRGYDKPIHLTVNMETGEIAGHEGRHRMLALQDAGVDNVAVIIDALNDDRRHTKPISVMKIKGQDFGGYRKGDGFYLHDALPLSERYADVVREVFSEVAGSVQYSLKGEHEMRREIDRIRSEGKKAGKSQTEIDTEVMGVVGPEYGKLLKTYGEIERGEKPYREISVPRRTEKGRKVSQTIRTVLEAEVTPDAAVPTLQELITQGDFSYDVYTDKAALATAEATIRNKGYETALADWLSDVKEGKVNKTNTALGWALYNAAATKGDFKTAMTILNGMVRHQRNAAQALQASRILKKMSPEAQLYGIQKTVDDINEELQQRYGEKAGNRSVSDADNVPVELWMQRTGELLAEQLGKAVKKKTRKEKTVSQRVLADLRKLARETVKPAAMPADTRTEMDSIYDMFNNKAQYEKALAAAKETVAKEYGNKPEIMSALDKWMNTAFDYTAQFTKEFTGQTEIQIPIDLVDKFLSQPDQDGRDAVAREIYRYIGSQMPSRFIDKWNAWRYLAMLGNPRTHVRNVVGNLGFAPVVMAKDMTATAIESAVSFVSGGKMGRTKAMPNLKLLKAAWADYANVADQVTAGGKYSDNAMKNQHIEEGRQIFKFKPLEKARKGNSAAMETEDMWFAQPHYAFALAQYCKAHGVTVDQLRAGKALGNGRDYAIREAQKATYRDTNAFSQTISELGRYHGDNKVKKGVSIVMEGILPFRKTPANILVRGIEYSPVGFVKGMTYDLYKVSKGELTAAEAIDNISAGLTGTGLLGLGIYMAAEGLIRGAGGDDEEEKKFEEMQGHQAYALELPNGKSITLDWLAPEVLPLFIGVNLYETARENKGMTSLSDILSAVSNVTEPLLEMSCLQSLNDLFDSVGYAASGNGLSALPTILASAATSYLTQVFPTILGQAERSAQDERMTTYTEKNGFLTSDMQYTLGKISAKLPGWDFNQIPYVDAWGRTESTGSKASNIANNFLNPAYTSQIETSEMEEELARLHDEKGDEYSVLPSRPKKYFNVDGERKDLTAEEYVEYATEKGQLSYDILTNLTGQKEYDKLPDAEKARAVELAFEYANAIAKTKVSDYEPDGWVASALKAEEFSGMDETEYILYKMALNMADQNNNANDSYDNTEKAAAIASMKNLSDADIAALLDTKDSYAAYDAGVDMRNLMDYIGEGNKVDVEKLIGAKQAGISENAYFSYTDTLKDVDQPNKNGEYGGTATNAEKAAAVAKMSNLDNEGIAYLWGTDQAHEAYSYGVDMKKYAQFKGVVDSFKGQDKQQQIKSYLKGLNLSAKDYLYLYGTVYSSVKDDADYLYYFGN